MINSVKYKERECNINPKVHMNLITRSLVVSVRDAFMEYRARKTDRLDLRSSKEMRKSRQQTADRDNTLKKFGWEGRWYSIQKDF